MRISGRMSWRLSAGILALVLLLAFFLPVPAIAVEDTGTYRITGYAVSLEPLSSGQVRITVEQDWQVLSGLIPWVTVGLPNSKFSVEESGGNASRVRAANSGGFSGVRVDLDREYRSGETFRVQFAVLQDNLLERLPEENLWRIAYTPGWYDRAEIDRLQVSLLSPVPLDTYSLLDPQPAAAGDGVFTWERTDLPPGGRLNIRIECLDGSFLAAGAGTSETGGFNWLVVIGALVVMSIIALIIYGIRQHNKTRAEAIQARVAAAEREMAENRERRKEIEEGFERYVEEKGIEPDREGRYYDRSYGGYITPAIWAAVILSQRNTGGSAGTDIDGKGSGGCVACACVSCACACACACAGGGAAGCARKTVHDCRQHQGGGEPPP